MEIKCTYDKLVPIGEIKSHPANPNQHSEEQINLLVKIITKTGMRSPLVVSKKSGFLVVGHGRLTAMEQMGVKEVPVDFQEFQTEAEEKSHLIADNKLAELSDMDPKILKDLIEELDTGETDLELTGYSKLELENLMSQFYVPENPIDLSEFEVKETCTLKIVCENLQELEKIQTKLGITAKETTGKVMLQRLK